MTFSFCRNKKPSDTNAVDELSNALLGKFAAVKNRYFYHEEYYDGLKGTKQEEDREKMDWDRVVRKPSQGKRKTFEK